MCIDRYHSAPQRRGLQRGLSLVEIMVGMVIAMIGVVIIFQMLATSEERKRSASSGSDMQVTGIVSITALERDIREAGHGFSSAAYDRDPDGTAVTPVMGCTVQAYDFARPVRPFTFTLAPVMIAQGGGTASDTITVLRGIGRTFPAAHVFTATNEATSTKKTLGRAGLSPSDMVIIANPTPECMLAQVTETEDNPLLVPCLECKDGLSVRFTAADGDYKKIVLQPDGTTSILPKKARYNNPVSPITFSAGFIFNLGDVAQRRIWTVTNAGKLLVTNDLLYVDTTPADGLNDSLEIGDNIINLQAEYGVDANNNGRIEAGEWTTTDPAGAQWANVLAVRMAILMRSPQYERTAVTQVVPNWSGGVNPDGTPKAGSALVLTNLDGTASSTVPAKTPDYLKN